MIRIHRFVIGCAAAAILAFAAATPADAGLFHHKHDSSGCCEPAPVCCEPAPVCCEPAPVCCPEPPPVQVQWCVVDPCTGCTYNVSACVPACCADAVPTLSGHRKGIFRRKVLTYTFACCGHCVDVVITKHGRTIVRD